MAAVVGRTSNEEIRFHLGNDGALGGIVKEGFDNDPRKGNLDSSKVSSYYTVTLGELLDHMKAPTVIDYLGLDVEGKNAASVCTTWFRPLWQGHVVAFSIKL